MNWHFVNVPGHGLHADAAFPQVLGDVEHSDHDQVLLPLVQGIELPNSSIRPKKEIECCVQQYNFSGKLIT